jgi:hypothetical protein
MPGIETVIQLAAQTSDERLAIAEHLEGDEEIDLPYQDKTYRYPKRFFLVHAMEHSTEHWTEVKVALAQIGVETSNLDGWQYAASAGYGQAVRLCRSPERAVVARLSVHHILAARVYEHGRSPASDQQYIFP